MTQTNNASILQKVYANEAKRLKCAPKGPTKYLNLAGNQINKQCVVEYDINKTNKIVSETYDVFCHKTNPNKFFVKQKIEDFNYEIQEKNNYVYFKMDDKFNIVYYEDDTNVIWNVESDEKTLPSAEFKILSKKSPKTKILANKRIDDFAMALGITYDQKDELKCMLTETKLQLVKELLYDILDNKLTNIEFRSALKNLIYAKNDNIEFYDKIAYEFVMIPSELLITNSTNNTCKHASVFYHKRLNKEYTVSESDENPYVFSRDIYFAKNITLV